MEHLYIYNPEWLADELQQLKKELRLVEELIAGMKRLNEMSQLQSADELLKQAKALNNSIFGMFEAIRTFTDESELIDRDLYKEYKMLLDEAEEVFD